MSCKPRHCFPEHHGGKCQDFPAHPKSISKHTLGPSCTSFWRAALQPGMRSSWSTALLLTLMQGTVAKGGSRPASSGLGVSLGCF